MPEDLTNSRAEYPQPEWNNALTVSAALEDVANVTDKESSWLAESDFLYACGNNHAGTYYPVVLTTFTEIEMILRSGKSWPQYTIIEALHRMLAGFVPEPGHDEFRGQPLSEMLRDRINGLKECFSLIATGNDVAGESAKDFLKYLG